MDLIISGRGVVLTPAFKNLVQSKVAKVTRVVPRAIDARVVCAAEKFRRTVRLVLHDGRRTFSAEATAGDLLTAMDDAVETLRRQAREAKARRRQLKGRAPRDLSPRFIEPVA